MDQVLSISNTDGTLQWATPETGDITSVVAGAGMTGGGTAGDVTLNVIGTADKITVNANDVTIASTYVGQTSITTLGTVATGTWNGTAVAAAYGGTGQTSYTTGDLPYASGSTAISKLGIGTANKVLTSSGSAPQWSTQVVNAALPTNIDVGGTLDVTGATKLDGALEVSGHTFIDGTLSIGYLNASLNKILIGGPFTSPGTSTYAQVVSMSTALTGVTGDTAWQVGINIGPSITTQASETIANVASVVIDEPGITKGSGATVTTASTLWIRNAPTEGASNYALFVDDGISRFDQAITVGKDTDIACYFGKGFISSTGTSMTADRAHFGHVDCETATDYAIMQTADGNTNMNCKTGQRNWFLINAGAVGNWNATGLRVGDSTAASYKLDVNGSLSKASGSFKIDHPLPSMNDTHYLIHSFVESPGADLIYRGTTTLVDGTASIDLDEAAGMTTGTWVLLCRDEQVFTSNETGWKHVRGSVTDSTLTIDCEDATCTDTVSWMVVANRHDAHMSDPDTLWTDDDGYPIIEPLKPTPNSDPPL